VNNQKLLNLKEAYFPMAKKKESNAESKKLSLKPLVFSALFAALLAAIAPFKIPLGFTPVPITLQTIVVLLSGAMLGPYYGALSMILYIVVGALGLPVFAGGSSGFGVLIGPTGGYLFSYFIAAFVIGMYVKSRKNPKYLDYVIAMLAGTIIIYVLGAAQGMLVTGLGLAAIITGWVLPFIIGDTIKLLISAYIANHVDMKKYIK
jgi:biotin transport system substrate-specific component